MRHVALMLGCLFLVPPAVAGLHTLPVEACAPEGALEPGDVAQGDTRLSTDRHRNSDAEGEGPDHLYRLDLEEAARVRVRVEPAAVNELLAWNPLVYVMTSCPGGVDAILGDPRMSGEPVTAERALAAGTYWIVVDGIGATSAGPYELHVDAVAATPPDMRGSVFQGVLEIRTSNVNRDTQWHLAGIPLDVAAWSDGVQTTRLLRVPVPSSLEEGWYDLTGANDDAVATDAVYVKWDWPDVVLTIVDRTPPRFGDAYAWDENVTLTVRAENLGTGDAHGWWVDVFVSMTGSGYWATSVPRPALAPGEAVELQVTVPLHGIVGDAVLAATHGGPQLLETLPRADKPHETLVHVLAQGHGVGRKV